MLPARCYFALMDIVAARHQNEKAAASQRGKAGGIPALARVLRSGRRSEDRNKKAAGASLRRSLATKKKPAAKNGLQGQDLNLRHRGYEPRALPTELPCDGWSCGFLLSLGGFTEYVGAKQFQYLEADGGNAGFTPLRDGRWRNWRMEQSGHSRSST